MEARELTMNDYPKISIVTPSFNQGKFLEKTILSVLEQGYPNLEYIIIDGGSTDNSVEIIRKYEKRLAYWVSEPDKGQSSAINKGFEQTTGEILGWLNSDDWYEKGALETVAQVFRENHDANVVVGAGERVDEEGKSSLRVAKRAITLASLFNWMEEFFWQPSCFFTRKAWNECGPLDVKIHYAMDLDYWIKIAKKYDFITTDSLISFNLKHAKAKTIEFCHLSIIETYWVILSHGGIMEARNGLERYSKRMEECVAGYENYTKRLEESVTNYQKHVSEINAHLDTLVKDRDALKQYTEKLSESIACYETQISELNQQIDTLVEDLDGLERYSKQLAETIAGYETQVSGLNTKVDSFSKIILDKDRRIDDLQSSVSWRITRPFRILVDIFYNLRSKIKESFRPKLTLLFNVFSLFISHPKDFIKNINFHTVSAFVKQFNRMDSLALEYEVRKIIANEKEKPVDYFALFPEQVDEKKILVIDRFVPAYDTNSGALRMFTILNILNELGYKVTFIPDNLSPKEPYVTELRSVGIEVICGDVNVEEYFVKYGPQFKFVILSEAYPAFNFMSYVRAYAVNATVLYDTVDIHWVRLERSAAISGSEDIRKEAEYVKKMELFNIKSSDVILTVTHDEKEYLEGMDSSWKVAVIPNIHEVVTQGITPFEQRKNIMFIGHFLHDPNVDAMKYFIKDIFPLIKKEIPGIKFFIVGSNPVKEVMDLKSDDIEITGYVKDVTPYFESCRVFVSPLRFGAGMKGKIGQSMTFGLPVVTTGIGAEGIGLTDEENVLIADDPVKFAQSVIKLYHNKCLWEKVSTSSMQYIDSHYSKKVVSKIIANLFESLKK